MAELGVSDNDASGLLTVEEVAARMNVPTSWAYENKSRTSALSGEEERAMIHFGLALERPRTSKKETVLVRVVSNHIGKPR